MSLSRLNGFLRGVDAREAPLVSFVLPGEPPGVLEVTAARARFLYIERGYEQEYRLGLHAALPLPHRPDLMEAGWVPRHSLPAGSISIEVWTPSQGFIRSQGCGWALRDEV